AGAGEAADAGALDDLADLLHRLEVAGRGDGKARLDNVHAHLVEQFGDLEFLFMRHGSARRLLAIAQRGVEDLNRGCVGHRTGHDKSPSVRRLSRGSISPWPNPLNTGRANRTRIAGLGAAKQKQRERRTEGRTGLIVDARNGRGAEAALYHLAARALRHGPVAVPPVKYGARHWVKLRIMQVFPSVRPVLR